MANLPRKLGLADSVFLVIGAVFGSGIFLTTGIMAASLPSPGLILVCWFFGGVYTFVGALIYAELGTLYPTSGGPYVYLKEAFGLKASFLYGWSFFWVIGGGGIAALAMGFSEYLGSLIPALSSSRLLVVVHIGPVSASLRANQASAIASILILSSLNCAGVRSGARMQNFLAVVRIAALAGFAGLAFAIGNKTGLTNVGGFVPSGSLPAWTNFGAAFLAVIWTYDGWYAINCAAEEVRDPGRTIPLALGLGTLAVTALYLLANIVYIISLPVARMSGIIRIGEASSAELFGPRGTFVFSVFIAVAILGCLSANILFCPRVSFAMARDGLFFRRLSFIHPRFRVPSTAIIAQMIWAGLLCLTGTYQGLIEYVAFALVLFFAATGLAVLVMRRKAPGRPRPFRVWGYPLLPIGYILVNVAIGAAVILARPVQAMAGAGLIAAGIPAYFFWKAENRPAVVSANGGRE